MKIADGDQEVTITADREVGATSSQAFGIRYTGSEATGQLVNKMSGDRESGTEPREGWMAGDFGLQVTMLQPFRAP
jgi:hypothetical protein